MNTPVTIAVVDDHPLLREGVISILNAVTEFNIIGQGESMDDAIHLAREKQPDIMTLDISMPGGGVQAAQQIHSEYPSIKLMMLTVSEAEKDVVSTLKAGVKAYILKGIGGQELVRIVHKIAAGESFITPSLAANILVHSADEDDQDSTEQDLLDTLSKRESEILKALERGLTNKQIADELFLCEKTIKHYMTNILHKLQLNNRVEAALLAQKMTRGNE